METTQTLLPRSVNRETNLVEDGRCLAGIIFPAHGAEYRVLAEALASTLAEYAGSRPAMWTDAEVMPERVMRLPDTFRSMPLILLGDINTNRTLVNLYCRHRCFTDADFPGGEGFELRTVINAYTRGNNVIVAGGSTLSGVARGVNCLIETIRKVGQPNQVRVPFLLDVQIAPVLQALLDSYPLTALDAPKPTMTTTQGYEIMRVIGNYGMMYAITGDRRYGDYGAECLRMFNAVHTDSYGDRHYFMERILHSIYWLQAGGFFSHDETLHMDRLLLGMLYGAQDNWWRRKDGSIPLGHRHQSKGTYEFLQVARFLKENAYPSPAAEQQCNVWIEECEAFMDALCRAGIDDQDDETTLNNMSNLFWYSLNQERFFFFESGGARMAALRALALHDNMGAGAGQGGYGESHMSAMYTQQDATTAVAAAAFYYGDGQLKWILENLPHLKEPLRGSIFIHTPIFMHNFGTGDHLAVEDTRGMVGIQALPITEHQYVLNTNPPSNWCKLGHFVNAPETWELAEGIGKNDLTRAEGFDKLTLRGSFDPQDAYLLLQGYQGGFNWQGHQQAANCIVRFSQFGKIFLIQNSRQHTGYDKNGLLISGGWNVEGLSPYARLDGMVEGARLGATVTSVPHARGAEWRRHMLWNKDGQGYFAVIDAVKPDESGEYSLTCTWRTPGFASADGRVLTAGQGAYTFTIVCGEDLRSDLREEPFEGAASPYVWRQYLGGTLAQGEVRAFHNLFYAREDSAAQQADIQIVKIDETRGVIREHGAVAGWYRIADGKGGHKDGHKDGQEKFAASPFETDAELVWSAAHALLVTGAKNLRWPGGVISAEMPFHLSMERDGAGSLVCQGAVTWNCDAGLEQIAAGEWKLEPAAAQQLVLAAWQQRETLAPAGEPAASPDGKLPRLAENWCTKNFGLAAKRIRDTRIFCSPQPMNGFDEQLIDGVPIELREFWQMWPDAPEYQVRLRFQKPLLIDTMRLLADSYDEPLMRVFNALPEETRIISRGNGLEEQHRAGMIAETVAFRRYRGQLDRVAGHRVVIGREVDEIELNFKIPPDRSFALQEIELYGGSLEPVRVRYLLTEDLEASGTRSAIIITEANEVMRLDAQGGVCWRQQAPGAVLHASFHDLLGNGHKYLCLGILGGELRVLCPDGSLYRSVQLAEQFQKPQSLFGWMETVHGLAVWRRDGTGRAALAVGSYGTVIYLDPDFKILGHTYVDGSWIYQILPTPTGGPDGEIWVRSGWNHGLNVYRGLDSFAPSNAFVDFGGMQQPLFRAIDRVIPFYTGATVAFEWVETPAGGRILAACEYGLGLMDPNKKVWDWRYGGLPRVTACLVDSSPERPTLVTAAMDGFVTVLDLETGALLNNRWLGSPVVGLADCAGKLAAAAQQGLFVLNARLETLAFTPLQAKMLVKDGPGSVLVLDQQDGLRQYSIS